MLSYLVIGICIFLLIAVIYISAKPISMGIEARRNINVSDSNDDSHSDFEDLDNAQYLALTLNSNSIENPEKLS